MARKPHPEKVIPSIGYKLIRESEDRQSSWTAYIIAHYRATGDLAPGCDARDWFAWYDMAKNAMEVPDAT